MPCYEPPVVERYEAYLCGIVAVLKEANILDQVVDVVDWKQVGVEKERFLHWLASHDKPVKYGDYKR